MIVGGVLTALGLARFLMDWKKSDLVDVVLLFVAGLMDAITAASASTLDFECTGGATCVNGVQTYGGNYFFFYLFDPFWLICWFLAVMAAIIAMAGIVRRRRGY